jgi:VIT1/CCC1 family predicted Fe2+/Mn2+ transporter
MLKHIRKRFRLYQTKFSFGATSGIITNLGIICGLWTGAHPKLAIIGAMLLIAIADNISDSVGIHIYQESELLNTREIWISTFTNFLARILVSLTFILLVIILPIKPAVICAISWGLLLLAILSYTIAKDEEVNPYLAMFEHVSIAVAIVILSNYIGGFVISKFKL